MGPARRHVPGRQVCLVFSIILPTWVPRKPHNHRGSEADSYSTRRALSNGARHFARDAREVENPDFSGPPATLRTKNHSSHTLGVLRDVPLYHRNRPTWLNCSRQRAFTSAFCHAVTATVTAPAVPSVPGLLRPSLSRQASGRCGDFASRKCCI